MNSNNFLVHILNQYGIKTVLFAVIFAFFVWGLAHWTAAPGSEISILWGFVQYTKNETVNNEPYPGQALDPNNTHPSEKSTTSEGSEFTNNKKPENKIDQRTEGNQSPAIVSNGDVIVDYSKKTKNDDRK